MEVLEAPAPEMEERIDFFFFFGTGEEKEKEAEVEEKGVDVEGEGEIRGARGNAEVEEGEEDVDAEGSLADMLDATVDVSRGEVEEERGLIGDDTALDVVDGRDRRLLASTVEKEVDGDDEWSSTPRSSKCFEGCRRFLCFRFTSVCEFAPVSCCRKH